MHLSSDLFDSVRQVLLLQFKAEPQKSALVSHWDQSLDRTRFHWTALEGNRMSFHFYADDTLLFHLCGKGRVRVLPAVTITLQSCCGVSSTQEEIPQQSKELCPHKSGDHHMCVGCIKNKSPALVWSLIRSLHRLTSNTHTEPIVVDSSSQTNETRVPRKPQHPTPLHPVVLSIRVEVRAERRWWAAVLICAD